jgi:hypothetical protein
MEPTSRGTSNRTSRPLWHPVAGVVIGAPGTPDLQRGLHPPATVTHSRDLGALRRDLARAVGTMKQIGTR